MTDAAGRQRTEADEARKRHRQAWFLVFVLGAAVIFAANRFGLGGWWPAILSSTIMALYWGFLAAGEREVPDETKADGFYYLGLLFTFASLIMALVAFDPAEAGDEATADVIGNFGIALLTTIIGLAGRVWFTLAQQSAGDSVHEAERDLERAIRDMRHTVGRAGQTMESLVGQLAASASGLETTARKIARTAESAGDTAAKLDEFAGTIAEASEPLADGVEVFRSAVTGMRDATSELTETLTTARGRAARFGDRFDGLDNAADAARAKVTAVADSAEAVEAELRREAEAAAGRLAGSTRHATKLQETLLDIREALSTIESTVRSADTSLSDGAARLDADLRSVGEQLSTAATTLSAARTEFEGVGGNASAAGLEAEALREEMSSLRGALSEARTRLGEMTTESRSLETHVGRVSQRAAMTESDLVSVTADLKNLRTQADATLRALQRAQGTAEATVDAVSAAESRFLGPLFRLWRRR